MMPPRLKNNEAVSAMVEVTPPVETADFALDACVLVSGTLRHLFLRAALGPYCRVYWSDRVLVETVRTLIRLGHLDPEGAEFWRSALASTFPGAEVAPRPSLVAQMPVQASDRHVAAAAIAAGAPVIVTLNLRDFPPTALVPWGLRVLTPDRALLALWRASPEGMRTVVRGMVSDAPGGYEPWAATLFAVRRVAPRFARALEQDDGIGRGEA